MIGLLIRWLLNAIALLLVAHFVPGFAFDSFGSALIAAAVLGLLNTLVRPVLFLLTLPITLLTLGLFLLVLNAVMLELTDWLVGGLHITSFWSAIIGALILSVVTLVTDRIGRRKKKKD